MIENSLLPASMEHQARQALSGCAWFNGTVAELAAQGEIIAGRKGASINNGQAKAALQRAGFTIGSTSLKPFGRR